MINRYSSEKIAELWQDKNKFRVWQEVELAVCQARYEAGEVDKLTFQALAELSEPIDLMQLQVFEKQTQHETIAFLKTWRSQPKIKAYADILHYGMTSSDLLDTAQNLLLKESGKLILLELAKVNDQLKRLALEHKFTPIIGRTHGIHAEYTSFGLKLAIFFDDFSRASHRIESALEQNRYGKFSGAVGNYPHLSPDIEKAACEILGLKPALITNQIISRDRLADFVFSLGILGSVIEKIALEIRHLQRTEVMELAEPFMQGQKGSSAMPHKRNPWKSENLCGLARLLRSYIMPALENIALWHERDMSHSSVERVMLPDQCSLAHFSLLRLNEILANLEIFPENMRKNIELSAGMIHSQKICLALIAGGLEQSEAYDLVQKYALTSINCPALDFQSQLSKDPTIQGYLNPEQLKKCFELDLDHKTIEEIYAKVFRH